MPLFALDPQSTLQRIRASVLPARIPTLTQSLFRGILGFTLTSIAGFLPWVLAGQWLYRNPPELVMYLSCAAIFIALSGLLLHPLIIGPGSLQRFYLFFGLAFAAYALAWIAGWMGLRSQPVFLRSLVGLFAGTLVMALLFSYAFAAPRALPKITAALFLLNSLGYFAGGGIESILARQKELHLLGLTLTSPAIAVIMKLAWGACFGLGFGAGLGLAFHLSQAPTRTLLCTSPPQTKDNK